MLWPGNVTRTTGSGSARGRIDDKSRDSSCIWDERLCHKFAVVLVFNFNYNENQEIVAVFNKLSMLPIASLKNAGTEMILERFTLTMFHCKRQTWICTTRPSFTLTWLLQNKSCLGQFLSAPFLFWIYNCRKRDSEVSLYCSLKYYWKTNETSNENQSLVTILLTSLLFLLYNK